MNEMELTPQQLCDVEFSEQWRGYSRDQVDDFIERVAAAVSTLQDRLRKMTERAVRAEQRSYEGVEADGATRRTLVLAQRTADATVAEAKETAARLLAQAQEEARAIMLAAETSVEDTAATVSAAPPGARAEIVDLEVTRSRLQADVATLEAELSNRRSRIKGLLDELQHRVDEGLEGHIARWPSFSDRIIVDLPATEAGQPVDQEDEGAGTGYDSSFFDLEPEPPPAAAVQPDPPMAPAAEPAPPPVSPASPAYASGGVRRSEEHTSELQSH